MIAIAGGTGRLGSDVVRRLAGRGLDVRVLTRDPRRAAHLGADVAEIIRCDVRDRAQVESAIVGATTLVSAVHGFAGPGRVSPESVDRDGNHNLVDAASAADADVILMSVVGASPDNPMELFRAKAEAERHLRASGVRWTIVRATAFAELWAEIMNKPIVFGHGENPINFVSTADVATVVERAVIDETLRGKAIDVGGPRDLTFNEFARMLQEIRGDSSSVRHVPRWLLRAAGPFSRRARAAVAMDTIDLSFADSAESKSADLPMTDIRDGLTAPL